MWLVPYPKYSSLGRLRKCWSESTSGSLLRSPHNHSVVLRLDRRQREPEPEIWPSYLPSCAANRGLCLSIYDIILFWTFLDFFDPHIPRPLHLLGGTVLNELWGVWFMFGLLSRCDNIPQKQDMVNYQENMYKLSTKNYVSHYFSLVQLVCVFVWTLYKYCGNCRNKITIATHFFYRNYAF